MCEGAAGGSKFWKGGQDCNRRLYQENVAGVIAGEGSRRVGGVEGTVTVARKWSGDCEGAARWVARFRILLPYTTDTQARCPALQES